ncbi:MAG: efflux RND transporter periplasmic adaptor subunit [Candidatus Eisenbacteria bacterium]|uniref:Efflux RND transporter periplasmic adaptor subunit n=1 Tax=Eiseniibacteriota bacterium TaxID=2212470 RepID=A0A956NH32_UNCEI|nr:efflux RND transporter periplasmic adaptor subunit [Candidatus Eisenbacteria bacterium]
MTTRNVLLGVVLLSIGLVLGWAGRGCGSSMSGGGGSHSTDGHDGASTAEAHAVAWTCSMHPQIRLPEPVPCPICGMDLIPVDMSDGGSDPGSITLSPTARKLASVRTSTVRRAPAEREVRLTGVLRADETREREIAAWISGRVERLYVDFTGGPVRKGQPLLDLYSPELLSAQEELVQAVAARAASSQLGGSGAQGGSFSGNTAAVFARTEEAAREKLRLLGLSSGQIDDIARTGDARAVVTIPAPLSGVVLAKRVQLGQTVKAGETLYQVADLSRLWLELEAYESDLPWIAKGDDILFETDAYPGETFQGVVSFVEPTASPATRTVRVRVEIANADGRLKPAMFARARVYSRLQADDGEDPVVIPATAPLLTGERAVVYVADPAEEGRFQARQVVLGPKAGDVYVVADGLRAGEEVVTRGAFKIDSALQIRAGDSMMGPSDMAPASSAPSGDAPGEPMTRLSMSTGFRSSMDTFFLTYFELSEALSKDDPKAAGDAFRRMIDAARSTEGDDLPASSYAEWRDVRRELLRLGTSLEDTDVDALRTAFHRASDLAIRLVNRFGVAGADTVYTYHCPMAFSNTGADWLQRRRGVENPYFGASMYRCGSETAVEVRPTAAQK